MFGLTHLRCFWPVGEDVGNMFTLVYMDWDVLLVQDGKESKGAPIVDYTQDYVESILKLQ